MASLAAIAYNVFESIGIVSPRIEVVVRDGQPDEAPNNKRMEWAHETDSNGRRVLCIRWVEPQH